MMHRLSDGDPSGAGRRTEVVAVTPVTSAPVLAVHRRITLAVLIASCGAFAALALSALRSNRVYPVIRPLGVEGPLHRTGADDLPLPRTVGARVPPLNPPPPTHTIYVATFGTDETGSGSEQSPYRTIAKALKNAFPGTAILVGPGTYGEYLTTSVRGRRGKPIVLQAVGHVVLTGDETHGRIMDLQHDYYYVDGFEFTGKDVLLRLQDADSSVITRNVFHHADGECVRVKYLSSNNLIERNRIEDCGLADFVAGAGGKNGEAIYIGTAPEQRDRNPTSVTDRSRNNVIRNNTMNTRGNECVDIKEGATGNIVEFNDCTGQQDPDSGGLSGRGNRNVFRYNKISGNVGAGVRLGGDTSSDGTRNDVYGNEIVGNNGYAIKVMRLPQGTVCGNTVADNGLGLTNNNSIENPPCAFPLLTPGVRPP